MIPTQGRLPDNFQLRLIVSLLARTDMSFEEIAQRRDVSVMLVSAINRKYEVRDYAAFRDNYWKTVTTAGERKKAG